MSSNFVEDENLSDAWVRAARAASATSSAEVAPLVVSITGFSSSGDPKENAGVRKNLDEFLSRSGRQSVHSVANTIFPNSLWNPALPRKQLYERYQRSLPRIRAASKKNRRGLYFERMLTGGPAGRENQLEFALSTFAARTGTRRSVLQLGVFQPSVDHSAAAMLGFPCLQHVTFAPTESGLSVNAFYATQYLVERAYGNYLGLCRLGKFVAHELKLPLVRVTCFAGIAELETSKSKIAHILS